MPGLFLRAQVLDAPLDVYFFLPLERMTFVTREL